jgi:hypothetical protein
MIRLGGNSKVPTLADANGREIPRKPQNNDFFAVILTSCQQVIHNRMGPWLHATQYTDSGHSLGVQKKRDSCHSKTNCGKPAESDHALTRRVKSSCQPLTLGNWQSVPTSSTSGLRCPGAVRVFANTTSFHGTSSSAQRILREGKPGANQPCAPAPR